MRVLLSPPLVTLPPLTLHGSPTVSATHIGRSVRHLACMHANVPGGRRFCFFVPCFVGLTPHQHPQGCFGSRRRVFPPFGVPERLAVPLLSSFSDAQLENHCLSIDAGIIVVPLLLLTNISIATTVSLFMHQTLAVMQLEAAPTLRRLPTRAQILKSPLCRKNKGLRVDKYFGRACI